MKSHAFLAVASALIVALFAGCPKPPAAPDRPWGAQTATRNIVTACSTRTSDPDAGEFAYQFDWGDGVQSAWSALMDGSIVWADTHTYTLTGSFSVKARAKTARSGASEWSQELVLRVEVGEGEVSRRFGFSDPEEPEDSADFSLNTFALGADGRSYVGCEWSLLFRGEDARRDKEFYTEDLDEFFPAPTLSGDSVLYIACANDSLYAFRTDGTKKWRWYTGDEVMATAALGSDGAIYVHTATDSLYALNSDGTRRWSFPSNGNSSPVIGTDGTVYVCSQEGRLHAIDPATGEQKYSYTLSGQAIDASPAIDAGRNHIYIADEEGSMVALELPSLQEKWFLTSIGGTPSSAVIGADGTVLLGAGGKLLALDPGTGGTRWTFTPPLAGTVSAPAVSDQGCIYVIVTTGKKDAFDVDSLYSVNLDGSRRWAIGLDFGNWDGFMSSPKIDAEGYIYFGDGYSGWVVRGLGGPAASPWPMFMHDGRNTGRASN